MSSLEIYDVNTWWGLVRGKSVALSSSPSISRKKKKKCVIYLKAIILAPLVLYHSYNSWFL